MKRVALFVLAALLLAGTSLAAGNNTYDRATIEKNYLEGLKSDNEGLKISAAYFLGEMKSDAAVFPLMKILRTDKSESARLIAALSLIKIEDAQGVYMVQRTATFNDSEKVRKMAKQLYIAHYLSKQGNLFSPQVVAGLFR